MSDINLFNEILFTKNFNLRPGVQSLQTFSSKFRYLLSERKWPKDGWDDLSIELVLNELAKMDANNFDTKACVGEREGRVFSSLVAKRHFHLAHGIGRSGNLTEFQPKANGSSLLYALTNELILNFMKKEVSSGISDAFIVPMATGMSLTLVLLTFKELKPNANIVIWPRIDQKSCFKSMVTAGLKPLIIDPVLVNQELQTDIQAITDAITKYGVEKILCVMTTTSCFAPRASDDVEKVGKICKDHDLLHLVNNAYGLQSGKCLNFIRQAIAHGKLDILVQSTDKNLLVPVGGAIIAGLDKELTKKIRVNYPGRASASPIIDVFITILSMGSNGYTELLKKRKENYAYLKKELTTLAEKYKEEVIETPGNQISIGMTLKSFAQSRKGLTELGSMLFIRNVTGARVIDNNQNPTVIDGHLFLGWGSNCSSYPYPYLTCAATVGMEKSDVDIFIKKLTESLEDFIKMNQEASMKIL